MAQPAFYQLRTVEQLGYIVKGAKFTHKRMQFFDFYVQSSNRNVDYLEHRINEFLESIIKKEIPFEEKDFESVKQAKINALKQKEKQLIEEISGNWDAIIRGELKFDRKEKMIEAYSKVTW